MIFGSPFLLHRHSIRSKRPSPLALFSGRMASWRSGDAEDCKSSYPGSIPGEASKFPAAGSETYPSMGTRATGRRLVLRDAACVSWSAPLPPSPPHIPATLSRQQPGCPRIGRPTHDGPRTAGAFVRQNALNAISGNGSLTARKVRGGHEREARCPPASKPLKKLVSLPGELLRYFGHRGFGVLISAPYRSLRVRPLSRHADQQVMTRGAITGAGAGGRSPSRSTWSWGRPRRYGSPGRLTQ